MKKTWLLLGIILSLFCMNRQQTFAAINEPSVKVADVTAEPGTKVDVPIEISNNTGICGATLQISYDEDLVLNEISSGDALTSMTFTKPGDFSANPINLVWDNIEADESNGTIAVLTFTTPERNGKYAVNISYQDRGIVDGNLNPVKVNVMNGSITVGGGSIVAKGSCGTNVEWSLNSTGVLTISGSGQMKNYTYKSEMPWYKYNGAIKSVVIKDGITTIGDYAFYGMNSVKQIQIPEGVKTIGTYAFKNSTGFAEMQLPKSLTKLGESAFYGCTSLNKINIPEGLYTIWGYTFKNCTG